MPQCHSKMKAKIHILLCAIKTLKYVAVTFDFISDNAKVQLCLWYCWANTETQKSQRIYTHMQIGLYKYTFMHTRAFMPYACLSSGCSCTSARTHCHPIYVTEWAGSGVNKLQWVKRGSGGGAIKRSAWEVHRFTHRDPHPPQHPQHTQEDKLS